MEQLVRSFGPAVRFHYALGQWAFLFAHPTHYRRILVENQQNYTKQHPISDALSVALGRGLVTSDRAYWLKNRRILQPAFHKASVQKFGSVIVRRTQSMIARWNTAPHDAGGQFLDVDQEMMQLTFGIVGEALFGLAVDAHTRRVDDAFSAFNASLASIISSPLSLLTSRLPITPSARRLHRAANHLRDVVDDIIASKQADLAAGVQSHDLLGFLLGARVEGDGAMPIDQVRDETMTLLLAGHETSATALTWTLFLIGEHPDVGRAISYELQLVLAGRTPTIDDLPALVTVRAAAQEAMRLYPPVYCFNRQPMNDDVVGGYRVPAGAPITLCPYLTHRAPTLWSAPDRFVPDRFMPGSPPPERFSYIPFSAGPRGCIGETFALTEIVLVLAVVLQHYELRARPGYAAEPIPLITLRPANGMPMVAMGRH